MNHMLSYNGYYGSVEYSSDDDCFHGKVFGLSDLILFEGSSVSELKKDFQSAIDEYLALCGRMGKKPEKYYKGSFNIRITPELHRQAALAAEYTHQTLNSFVENAIKNFVVTIL